MTTDIEAIAACGARIAELEAELKAWRKMIAQMDRLRLEQVERAEQAEAELATTKTMLDEALLLLFAAKAMDPSSPGARQLWGNLRTRAEAERDALRTVLTPSQRKRFDAQWQPREEGER